ncbi:hypothetical protein FOL47_008182 [Perkinsus chesapeaki]|uniref:RAP domain-containing protein n=1 Tax=Perkinsus chesapeaki TaxID=330153 RepID=A0A7J6MU97_PERCH|nr:hypothetical protein FOL47_008182 [Perkinsus chesapeaki]
MLNRSFGGKEKTIEGLLRPFNVPGWKKAHTPMYCIMTLRQIDKCVSKQTIRGGASPLGSDDLNMLMEALVVSGTPDKPLNSSLAAQAVFLLLKLGVSPGQSVFDKLIPLASQADECQDVCSLTWSIASCASDSNNGIPDILLDLYHQSVTKALSRVDALCSKDIGLAKAGLPLPSQVVDTCCRRKDLKLREAVHILWAVVKSAGEWRPELDTLVPVVRREWIEPNARDAIMAIWALVHSGDPSTIAWAVSPERLSGISMIQVNDQDRSSYAFALGQAVSTMSILKVAPQLMKLEECITINSSPREMSFFLWACASASRYPSGAMGILSDWVVKWYPQLCEDVGNAVRILWTVAIFDGRGADAVVPLLYPIFRQQPLRSFSSKEAAITLWSLFAVCGCKDIEFARQLATQINSYERAHRAQLYQVSLTLKQPLSTDPGTKALSSSALHTKVCRILGSEWSHEYAVVPGVVVDIAKANDKIAVEVNGAHHYIQYLNDAQRKFPDGATSWKTRYLTRLGWKAASLVEDDVRAVSHLPLIEQRKTLINMIEKSAYESKCFWSCQLVLYTVVTYVVD